MMNSRVSFAVQSAAVSALRQLSIFFIESLEKIFFGRTKCISEHFYLLCMPVKKYNFFLQAF